MIPSLVTPSADRASIIMDQMVRELERIVLKAAKEAERDALIALRRAA